MKTAPRHDAVVCEAVGGCEAMIPYERAILSFKVPRGWRRIGSVFSSVAPPRFFCPMHNKRSGRRKGKTR